MKRFAVAVWAVILSTVGLSSVAAAQSSYGFVSPGATPAQTVNHTTCAYGMCQSYPAGTVISIQFTTATPLPPNLVDADISTLVTDFVLTDGLTTMVPTDPQVTVNIFSVTTNASGQLTASTIDVYKWQGAKAVGQPLANIFTSNGSAAEAYVNATCTRVGKGIAAISPPDNCAGNGFNLGNSNASTVSPSPGVYSSPAAAVPTLSEWAMILFGTILAGGAALYIQRRRLTA